METSFKRCHACTATLSVPNPAVGYHHPMPQLETPENSWTRLGQPLVGSLLLSPRSWCSQGSVCALQESVSPVMCKLGVMATSSKRAYAIPRSISPRAPDTASIGDTQTQFWLSLCGIPGSWCIQGLFEPSECLWWVGGLILNVILPFLPSCWGFSFALQCGYLLLVGSNILLGEANGNPLQYSCLENPMDGGAW